MIRTKVVCGRGGEPSVVLDVAHAVTVPRSLWLPGQRQSAVWWERWGCLHVCGTQAQRHEVWYHTWILQFFGNICLTEVASYRLGSYVSLSAFFFLVDHHSSHCPQKMKYWTPSPCLLTQRLRCCVPGQVSPLYTRIFHIFDRLFLCSWSISNGEANEGEIFKPELPPPPKKHSI